MVSKTILNNQVTRINGYLKDNGSKYGYGLDHSVGRYTLYVVDFDEYKDTNVTIKHLRSLNASEMHEYLNGIESVFGDVLIRNK